jgi:hypothetical protein
VLGRKDLSEHLLKFSVIKLLTIGRVAAADVVAGHFVGVIVKNAVGDNEESHFNFLGFRKN